jgi:hypothetical protein
MCKWGNNIKADSKDDNVRVIRLGQGSDQMPSFFENTSEHPDCIQCWGFLGLLSNY